MHQNGYVGRKMRLPRLQEKPAIIIAAFGSTNKAKYALELFTTAFGKKYPEEKIYWAYTSEIIRKKIGLPSLQETLAQVEADGYRKAVVQPLHIFPGTEYQQLAETCTFFPGLRVVLGETLFHRWDFITEIIESMETEFLAPEEGYNLLAIHGTPLAADPANVIYLGLSQLLADKYTNVGVAAVEGVPDHEAVITRMARENLVATYKKIKIIPLMYFAGLHAEEDLMSDDDSWKAMLQEQGFEVTAPTVIANDQEYFKGMAYYPEVNEGFLDRLQRALDLTAWY